MLIIKTGQCVDWQKYQIKDNIKQIPYWQRDHAIRIIIGRYVESGGDKVMVNYALTKLGVKELV